MNRDKIWSTMLRGLAVALLGLLVSGCSIDDPRKDSAAFEVPTANRIAVDADVLFDIEAELAKVRDANAVSDQEQKQLVDQVMALSESVAAIDQKFKDNVPLTREDVHKILDEKLQAREPETRNQVAKLVTTQFEEQVEDEIAKLDCKCNCTEQIKAIGDRLEDLEKRLTAVEPKPTATKTTVSSGGSTGTATVKSGGSSGTATIVNVQSTQVVKSGGSMGSVKTTGRQAVEPHITVVTTPSCTRCPRAIAFVQQAYPLERGWSVSIESEAIQNGKSYPYFRLCEGSQCQEISCDVSQLNTEIEKTLTSWGISFEPAPQANVQGTPQASAGQGPVRGAFKSAIQTASAPLRAANGVLHSWGQGRALEVAMASAQFRAANSIKGHSKVDLGCGMSNGVGWSPVNAQPKTCFWESRGRGAYASVQGPDGYYGTLVLY